MSLSLWLNIILTLSSAKSTSELSFCSRLKIYVLMFSKLAFVFKIIRPIIFFCSQESKFSTAMGIFHDQGIFPQSKKTLLDQGIFTQSRKFSTNQFYLSKEIFHKQGSFPQTKISTQSNRFSANKS